MVSRVFTVKIIKDESRQAIYLIIFCINGSLVLIIPNCHPFRKTKEEFEAVIQLKEELQRAESGWCARQKFLSSNVYLTLLFRKKKKENSIESNLQKAK